MLPITDSWLFDVHVTSWCNIKLKVLDHNKDSVVNVKKQNLCGSQSRKLTTCIRVTSFNYVTNGKSQILQSYGLCSATMLEILVCGKFTDPFHVVSGLRY